MMNRPRLQCIALVILFVFVGNLHANTVFYDTFDDGDASDASPVRWTPVTPGTYDASSGDFVFTAVPETGRWDLMKARAEDIDLTDTSIRAAVNFQQLGHSIGIQARDHLQDETGYVLFVSEPERRIALYLNNSGDGDPPITLIAEQPLPFQIVDRELMVQLDVMGDRIQGWAWRASEPMPSEPQVDITHAEYTSGSPSAMVTTNGSGTGMGLFHWIHVSDEPITTVEHQTSYEYSRLPIALHRTRDSNFDGKGDRVDNILGTFSQRVGETDASSTNYLSRVSMKYELPNQTELGYLEKATLRLYLESIGGTPVEALSVFHSEDDNSTDRQIGNYEDETYHDTGIDLVQPTDPTGQYYELDVTDFVLDDYRFDQDTAVSAFRLQVGTEFVEDNVSAGYRFMMPGNSINHPELLLTFDPLPCDVNDDGHCDVQDIDAMTEKVLSGEATREDRTDFIEGPAPAGFNTYVGDSNLDGQFDSEDFVVAFIAGKWLTGERAGWAEGDWDGNFLFTDEDIVASFISGCYLCVGPRGATLAVPEPAAWVFCIPVMLLLAQVRRALN